MPYTKPLILATLGLIACGAPRGGEWATQQEAIVGGNEEPGYPAVGSVDALGAITYCSGTLVASKTLLTAGHCLPPDGVEDEVSFADASFAVERYVLHPRYTGEGKPFDVALFQLKSSPGIVPISFARRTVPQLVPGAPLLHVGYGATQGGLPAGLGTKREETSSITRLDTNFVYSGDAQKNTCNGDSGGPGLLPILPDGGEVLVSIISDGPSCTTEGWDVRVDEVADWIVSTATGWESQFPTDPQPLASNDAGITIPPSPSQGCAGSPALDAEPLSVLAVLVWLWAASRVKAASDSNPQKHPS